MKLGLSLPVEFLSGMDTSTDTEHLREAFGEPDVLLEEARKRGVGAVEIKSMYVEAAPEMVLKAFRKVYEFDMAAMLHGYLPAVPLSEPPFPPFTDLFEHLREASTELIMIVHALRDETCTLEQNRENTVAAMRTAAVFSREQGYSVRFAVEINRKHTRPDPSCTYGDVQSMAEAANEGICFDFGHTFWNVEHNGLDTVPPAGFLSRVIHTHIHDIGAKATHYPLSLGTVPVPEYVRLLAQAGYAGVYNLELACHRFVDEFEVKEAFTQSIDRLKQAGL